MDKHLKSITTYLLGLSLRERLLLLLIFITVIYAAWDGLIYSKQTQLYQQLITQKQELAEQYQQKQVTLAENLAALRKQNSSKEQLLQEIANHKQQLTAVNVEIDQVLSSLVPPTKITELLHSLLLKTQGLKLLALSNKPVEAISIFDNEQTEEAVSDSQTNLYKHSTTMILLGDYQQLYHYLKMIEQSKWGLYWDQLEYKVTDYPKAQITLDVHTVSSDQYWIGL